MNIQHSSRTDKWYTPIDIIARVHLVLGHIDLDPASDEFGNSRVDSIRYITKGQNGLKTPWAGASLFINPPGGKTNNQSNTALFWDKLIKYKQAGSLGHAVFLAFSLEAMQTTQKSELNILNFPLCVPKKRIKFDRRGETKVVPSHSNVIVYVPGFVDHTSTFQRVFEDLGGVIIPKGE